MSLTSSPHCQEILFGRDTNFSLHFALFRNDPDNLLNTKIGFECLHQGLILISTVSRNKRFSNIYTNIQINYKFMLMKLLESHQQLREQIKQCAASTNHLKNMLSQFFQGLGTALPVLEALKKQGSFVTS